MGSVWFTLRAGGRRRLRTALGLALLLGVIGGVALTAAAGARRTDTAYPRLLRWANATQLGIVPLGRGPVPDGTGRTGYYTALGRLPQVTSVSPGTQFAMALPLHRGAPDFNVNVSGSFTGAVGPATDRVKVLSGRLFNPADPHAAMVDQQLATLEHLRPGSTLHLLGIPGFLSTPDVAHAVPFTFRVSAVVQFDDQIVATNDAAAWPRALLSPAFAGEAAAQRFRSGEAAGVRLQPGASMAAFGAAARALAARYPATGGKVLILPGGDAVTATERAIFPEVVALAAFAALAGLITLAIIGQLLSRQLSLDATEFPIFRVLGMSRGKLAALSMTRLAAVTGTGSAIAVGVAIAASPLMPIGPARLAEPSPGIEVNLAILGAGFAAIALLPLILVAPAAWRAAARAQGPLGVAELATAVRASRLGSPLGVAGSVTGGIGVRLAFEPGHGRTAVPVRSALVGTTVAVASVLAALIFGTSLIGLVSTPHQYGQNWSEYLNFDTPSVPRVPVTRLLAAQHGLLGYAGGDYGTVNISGRAIEAIGIDPLHGRGYLTRLTGSLPSGPDQIVLGRRTLQSLHRRLGARLHVVINGRPYVMHVVGEAVFASFSEGGSTPTDLGQGAAVAASLLSTPFAPSGCVHGETCYSFILVRYPPGAARTVNAGLQAAFTKVGCTPGCYTAATDQRPSDIRNYTSARDTPLVLGAVLAVLAVGTLAHVLLTGVRRRRRDLAVLKTLGLRRSQVLSVVMWQACALCAVAVAVGLPVGVITGRWAWGIFAGYVGVASNPVVPVLTVLAVIPVALLLATAIAAGPGWAAARVRPAVILRSE
jgi:FtsX-like permease family